MCPERVTRVVYKTAHIMSMHVWDLLDAHVFHHVTGVVVVTIPCDDQELADKLAERMLNPPRCPSGQG